MENKRLWKSMKGTTKKPLSDHGNVKWKIGKWYKIKGDLSICSNGFHASCNIIDAMSYVNMKVLALVEVRGECVKEKNKECWSEMRIINTWRWSKKDSVNLAIQSAELVISSFEIKYPDDKRPRNAIEAAKKYLKNPCQKTKSAAWSAAKSAESAASAEWSAESAEWSARSAARSAESAARSAEWSAESAARSAESAARSAARSAESAESAERSARIAAWSALLNKCHSIVKDILNIND